MVLSNFAAAVRFHAFWCKRYTAAGEPISELRQLAADQSREAAPGRKQSIKQGGRYNENVP